MAGSRVCNGDYAVKLSWRGDSIGWVDLYSDGGYTHYSYKRVAAGKIITVTPHDIDEPEFEAIKNARAWLKAMYVLRTG